MKLAYRSPRFFRHGGIWLQLWSKWYRIFAVNDPDKQNDDRRKN